MTPEKIETIYEAIAETMDVVGPRQSELFLAKLALLLAKEVNDVARVLSLIESARRNLEASS